MSSLEISIAQFFPGEYTPDTWPDLLPRFIARHMEIYIQRVREYNQELDTWQQGNHETPELVYPCYPVEFALSCEEQAKREGFCFRALAVTFYLNQALIDHFTRCNAEVVDLFGRCQSVSQELADKVNELNQQQQQYQLGLTPGRRLN